MTIERNVAGMRCGEVLEELSDYLDGELVQARRAQVEDHLHGCDVCERFGGAFTAAIRALHQENLEAGEGADPGVFERLRQHLAEAPHP
jgi:anti-sigma factor RsiW